MSKQLIQLALLAMLIALVHGKTYNSVLLCQSECGSKYSKTTKGGYQGWGQLAGYEARTWANCYNWGLLSSTYASFTSQNILDTHLAEMVGCYKDISKKYSKDDDFVAFFNCYTSCSSNLLQFALAILMIIAFLF